MRIDTFKFSEVEYFSKLISDYTTQNLQKDLYPTYPLSLQGIEEQLNTPYPLLMDRKLLSETILNQYQKIDISTPVKTNIESLQNENTYTVVTAHQLSTFGGPLYYVIKIANAIAFARKLRAEHPQSHFVPVYWMGSEDHDFEEVNHIYLFGKKITWESEQTGPVGRFKLDEGAKNALQEVFEILGENTPDDIDKLLSKAYAHKNAELATRELVNGLFGNYGLVIVNGDDVAMKRAMIPVIKEELLNKTSYPLLKKRSQALIDAGYHAQAHGREINLFHLGDTYRTRIEPTDGGFLIQDKLWTQEQLLTELEEHPERFSPNVVLRPLFQQAALPNVAFIGGGGEIAYWLQLIDIFKLHQVRYPVLIPRTSIMFINHANFKRLQKLELKISDLFRDKEEVKKEYLMEYEEELPNLDAEKNSIAQILEQIKQQAEAIDKTLGPATGADGQRILNTIDQMQGKMLRAIKQRNRVSLNQIDGLYQTFYPNNTLQERNDNFLNFYSRYGKNFIDWLVQYLSVIEQEFVVITETEKLSLH